MTDAAPQLTGSSRRHSLLTGLVSVFHFAALGSLVPVLPQYLRETIGLTWTHSGLVMSAFAVGVATSGLIVRLGRRLYFDARLGLAASHLLAGAVVMGIAWCRQKSVFQIVTLTQIASAVGVYSICLLPSLRWMNELGAESAAKTGRGGNAWRLWGAVGFVAPAWLSEVGLIRFPELRDAVHSQDILLLTAGWASVATALFALLSPSNPVSDARTKAEDSVSAGPTRLPMLLLLAFVLMIFLQRGQSLWTAPFFSETAQRHGLAQPFVHRLVVVSHVAETFGLFLLVAFLRVFRLRMTMLLSVLAWTGRAVLLAWVSEAEMSVRAALSWLFAAQVLYGIGMIGFFGVLGTVLGAREDRRESGTTPILAGVAAVFAYALAGWLIAQFQAAEPSTVLSRMLQLFPSSIQFAGATLEFSRWSGAWMFSAVPGPVVLLLVLFARPPRLSD